VHSRQYYYGADLAFSLTFTFTTMYFHLPFFPPCRAWLQMTAWKGCSFAWVIGQWCDDSGGRSWDFGFVKQRDGLPNPSVGGEGLGRACRSPRGYTPRLWSIIVFMQVLDASPTCACMSTTRQEGVFKHKVIHLSCRFTPHKGDSSAYPTSSNQMCR
jgi:hypothetical protein